MIYFSLYWAMIALAVGGLYLISLLTKTRTPADRFRGNRDAKLHFWASLNEVKDVKGVVKAAGIAEEEEVQEAA